MDWFIVDATSGGTQKLTHRVYRIEADSEVEAADRFRTITGVDPYHITCEAVMLRAITGKNPYNIACERCGCDYLITDRVQAHEAVCVLTAETDPSEYAEL